MEFVNRPIIEFYADSLSAAYKRGFMWVVTLLAREVDVDGLYLNLRKSWISLDSITGKYFLFVFAGKENISHEECWASRIFDSQESYFSEYNDYVKFINQNITLENSHLQYKYYKSKDVNMNMLEENQTLAVNALRDYFSISENDIPCLVFTKLYPFEFNSKVIQIVPIYGNNIYGYFKSLFNKIEPLLKQHMDIRTRLKELAERSDKLKIKINQPHLKSETKIIALQKELLLYAEKNIVDADGNSLLDCINNLSYGKFDKPLRSMLNRYVDWVKNYEKRTGQHFDSNVVNSEICESAIEMAQAKVQLSKVEEEQSELGKKCGNILSTIERIIGDSKMDQNTRRDDRLLISVTGGTAQINASFDNAKVEATQYIDCNEKKLEELVENVRNALSIDISDDDIGIVNTNLDVLEEELKRVKPRKNFLKVVLKSLKAIKGTAEFGAAVTELVQFVQSML